MKVNTVKTSKSNKRKEMDTDTRQKIGIQNKLSGETQINNNIKI